jgi:uncharacterized protein (TIGR03435 family)
MIAFLGDHLWQSTIVALAMGSVALVLRANAAHVRYWLWLAASLKFLVPFAALAALGASLGWPGGAPLAEPQIAVVIDTVSQPFSQPFIETSVPAVHAGEAGRWITATALLLTVWLSGALAVAGTWSRRWRRVNAMARGGTRLTSGREVAILWRLGSTLPLVACDAALEPGVFGVLRPVLLWPNGISERLSDEQMAVVLSHELEHVRRHDNLAAGAHMVVQALFWFHPLVWWLGARLVHERERACDEAVLHAGGEPHVYAESLLKTCEFSIESPLPCISGVTGADLKRRIEAIMINRSVLALGRGKKLLLLTGGIAVLIAPVLGGGLNARPLPPQAPAGAGERLEFDVASIKPNDSGEPRVAMRFLPGGSYEATNVTLRAMIQQAYRVSERQVIGGPEWLARERFDILAKPPEGATQGQFPERLQALLADRVNLKTHRETREMPIYALVLARRDGSLGPQIRTSPMDCSPGAAAAARGRGNVPAPAVGGAGGRQQTPMPAMPPLGSEPRPCGQMFGGNRISGGGSTMAGIATMLQTFTGRIVQDRTGLSGSFDFDLQFTPDPGLRGQGPGGGLPPQPGAAPAADADAVSIFTAVQEQLGLRLESAAGPVDVLVIDSADRPSEN